MKTSIYSNRIELNNWEISGIEAFLKETFNLDDVFIYADKTIHLDLNENRYGIYKISKGEDLYCTIFNDDRENETFCFNLSDDNFTKLSENFDFICEYRNIFEF